MFYHWCLWKVDHITSLGFNFLLSDLEVVVLISLCYNEEYRGSYTQVTGKTSEEYASFINLLLLMFLFLVCNLVARICQNFWWLSEMVLWVAFCFNYCCCITNNLKTNCLKFATFWLGSQLLGSTSKCYSLLFVP